MQRYSQHFRTVTPQHTRIPESQQVRNRAGGWVFPVTDEVQLDRFLILGTDQGSYYASARELTRESATVIERLLEDGKGPWLVDRITEISESGRAPKNDPAIFALAMALKLGDLETRRRAAVAVPRVCRTATHLASLAEAVKVFSAGTGWGPITKRAFVNWLDSKTDDQLAYQLVKYRQRQGWTLRDVLRKAKPKPGTDARSNLYAWAITPSGAYGYEPAVPSLLESFEEVQSATRAAEVVKLVEAHNLPWEAIPDRWAKNLDVQAALFERMPITATIRQLGRLSSIGLLEAKSNATKLAVERITNEEILKRGRVHPMSLYLANEVYQSGHGLRGKLTWTSVQSIVDALGTAFFQSFRGLTPTGKTIVVGVDTSGSMTSGGIMGVPAFRCVEAAFVMAYVTLRSEPNARGLMFTTSAREFNLRGVETLSDLGTQARRLFSSFSGGTDVAQPILHATRSWSDVDAFVVYTDDETWAGGIHPVEANFQYRQRWGRATKLVSTAFVAHGYSTVPADDANTLAVVGFDESAPSIISDFLAVDNS